MSRRVIGLIVMLAFAITLAIVVGNRLSAQAMAIALGVAVGVAVGVPVGILAATLKPGSGSGVRVLSVDHHADGGNLDLRPGEVPTTIILTADQADVLIKVLQRQQIQPESFALAPRQQREFTVVGGADLPIVEDGDIVAES